MGLKNVYRKTALEPLTDMIRLEADLTDLPFKAGYGEWFRIELQDGLEYPLNWMYPLLHVKGSVGIIKDKWFTAVLIMAGYPSNLDIRFLDPLPRCPTHGGKHPHVFSDGSPCWDIVWSPAMDLYADYILVIGEPRRVARKRSGLLNYPQHHIGCGYL